MHIGIFQLLPRGSGTRDREVVEQALWEVDLAKRHGFESVWSLGFFLDLRRFRGFNEIAR